MKQNELHFRTAVSALMGEPVVEFTRLAGGLNNVCAKIKLGQGGNYLAKFYAFTPGDVRDRLGTEFSTLQFLWDHGVRCVPEPVKASRADHLGVYEFIKGRPISMETLKIRDVDALAGLLVQVGVLPVQAGSRPMPAASDAVFCLNDYIRNLCKRMKRVEALVPDAQDRGFARFIQDELVPVHEAIQVWFEGVLKADGFELMTPFPARDIVFSPADHGFHNAIRRRGDLVFLDFEYAGRDDVAQMILNACLQPRGHVPARHRDRFVGKVLEGLSSGKQVVPRMRLVYPLLCFKWALILINDYLPGDMERRKYAGVFTKARLMRQMRMARKYLNQVKQALAKGESVLDSAAYPGI